MRSRHRSRPPFAANPAMPHRPFATYWGVSPFTPARYLGGRATGGRDMSGKDRRDFLQAVGLAGMFSAIAPEAFAQSSGAFTVDPANTSTPEIKPTASIKFAAVGLDHAHIFG